MLSQPTILVCTDLKGPSDLAIKSAETIRKKVGGQIHVLHVSNYPAEWDWSGLDYGSLYFGNEELEKDHMKSLNHAMTAQLKRCNVSCITHVSVGNICERILKVCQQIKADIVMVGHGAGHLTAKIVASSSAPVMVIKSLLNSPLGRVAGLVDTTDFNQSIVLATEEFSYLLSAEAELVTIYKENDQTVLENLRKKLSAKLVQQTKCQVKVVAAADFHSPAHHLTKILQDDGVELAIMKRHQKSFFKTMLMGSETKRMLELFDQNVLVLPPDVSANHSHL